MTLTISHTLLSTAGIASRMPDMDHDRTPRVRKSRHNDNQDRLDDTDFLPRLGGGEVDQLPQTFADDTVDDVLQDIPSEPMLPRLVWDGQTDSLALNRRKRVRAGGNTGSSVANSSDPAVFSSDDDPALDNYHGNGRRKKRYIGTWFQQQPTSSDSTFGDMGEVGQGAPARRAFTRQHDSGVFLGSDATDDDDTMEIPIPTHSKLPQLDRPVVALLSDAERIVRQKVQYCLDTGDETIDCMSLGLEELSNDTISPLSQFTCIPLITSKDVAFEQRDPELKLFLGPNQLCKLPGAIFDLTYLTNLSLRGNELEELPPAISKLKNLRSLNVSLNRLLYLPFEILDLMEKDGKLMELTLFPNVYMGPRPTSDGTCIDSKLQPYGEDDIKLLPKWVVRYAARSAVQLNDSFGRVLSDFELSKIGDPWEDMISPDAAESMHPHSRLAAPSLIEVVMQSCYRSGRLDELASYVPEELPRIQALLEQAYQQKESGGLRCSSCRRLVVNPPLQWVEWFDLHTREDTLQIAKPSPWKLYRSMADFAWEHSIPFLRRACSWRCGPPEKPMRTETWMSVSSGRLVPVASVVPHLVRS